MSTPDQIQPTFTEDGVEPMLADSDWEGCSRVRQIDPDEALSSNDNIRLLCVESVSEDEFEYALVEAPLELAVPDSQQSERYIPFVALSYCWGDESPSEEIKINKKSFLVTPNLRNALRVLTSHLAVPDGTSELSHVEFDCLWVDAICINQRDDVEKSEQVQRMPEIYKGATKVLIWLGEHADDSKRVMLVLRCVEILCVHSKGKPFDDQDPIPDDDRQKLAHIGSELEKNYNTSMKPVLALHDLYVTCLQAFIAREPNAGSEHDYVRTYLATAPSQLDRFSQDDPFWLGFLSLFSRPWFSRIWTLQEAMLAREAIMVCGNDSFDFKLFQFMHVYFYSFSAMDSLYSAKAVLQTAAKHRLLRAGCTDVIGYTPDGAGALFMLLSNSGVREAKDPRDYVYGGLGIIRNNDAIKSRLRPNYQLSTADVYYAAIRLVVEFNHHSVKTWCDLLKNVACGTRNADLGLPSWCPDFSGVSGNSLCQAEFFHILESDVNAAILDKHSVVKFVEDRGIQLSAVMLDTVRHVAVIAAPPATLEAILTFRLASDEDVSAHSDLLDLDRIEKLFIEINRLFCEQDQDSGASFKNWIRRHLFQHVFKGDMPDDMAIATYRLVEAWLSFKNSEQSLGTFTGHFSENVSVSSVSCEEGLSETISSNVVSSDLQARADNAAQKYKMIAEYVSTYNIGGLPLLTAGLRAILHLAGKYFFITHGGRIGYSARPASPYDYICFIPGGEFLHILSKDVNQYVAVASVPDLMGLDLIETLQKEDSWQEVTLY